MDVLMNTEQIKRLDLLSDKVSNDSASSNELMEYKQLLDAWNLSTKIDVLAGLYLRNKEN